MSLAENAFFFFASVVVGIFIGIAGNWFVTEYLHYQDRVYSERGEQRPLNEIRNGWIVAIMVLLLIILFYIFLMFIASSLMQIEQNPTIYPQNLTLNTTNNYYNISPIIVKSNNSCCCNIVHIFNPPNMNNGV